MRSFSEISSFDFPKLHYQKIQDEINSNSKDYILKVDEEEFVKYLVNKYSLEPLNIIHESESVSEPKKSKVKRQNMWREEYLADSFTFTVSYQFTGSPEIFKIRSSNWVMTSNEIFVNSSNSTVSFQFTIYAQDVEEFNKAKSEGYSSAFTNLTNANNDVQQVINGFEGTVRAMFQRTKDSFSKENAFYTAVNIKTNPKTASVFSAPTIKKKDVFQPKVSEKKEFAAEPTMSQSMYEEILRAVYDCGKNMEKKPSLYIGKDEEGLRDQFVFVLETKYEGTTATGETFNRNGKTDIILKFAKDGSNLFVAECKLWHGPSEMLKAIDQLLSYLTWRDSKVALMLFVHNQNFTSVLDTIKADITKHAQYKKSVGNRGESSFSFIFGLPQDTNKDVQLEIMAFHYDKR